MSPHKVLITTSGIGSRLGELTKYTNKCLVRITDKPSISHIIESYPSETNFVISLGHRGDLVRQYLGLAHPDSNFEFVTVDNYDGPGSSLAYSILQCKDFLQCPFIFHCSDTIVEDSNFPSPTFNWAAGTDKEDASHYRTLIVSNGNIKKFNDKGEINYDKVYIGICGIRDYEDFFAALKYNMASTDSRELSDVHAIIDMMKTADFKYHHVSYDSWYDVGNVTELNRARTKFKTDIKVLDKADESIYFIDDHVIKFFGNWKVNRDRVERARALRGVTPNIVDSTHNFYKYKRIEGELLSRVVNKNMFREFLNWSHKNLWQHKTPVRQVFEQDCLEFYYYKTLARIRKYLRQENKDVYRVNGVSLPDIFSLIGCIPLDLLASTSCPVLFHGDFILDNAIKTKSGFKLIDWRQDFAGHTDYGDIYYDLAKLNHNLTINHDIIDRGLFSSNPDDCHVLVSSRLLDCRDVLFDFVTNHGFSLDKVKLLTPIIWLNMAPLHEYPLNEFLFAFGKYKLYDVLENEL